MRKRARDGEPIAAIARAPGVSEPTAGKYAGTEGLSPGPPRRREPESAPPAPHEGTVDSWPGDDCRSWRKQRHTATRVYVRLRDEEGYEGSHSTVQRYAKRRREEMARERDRRDAEGFLTLRWLPGEVQVDFGEADFRVRGVTVRGKCLTVSFPHSNVGLTQVFRGETAECARRGSAACSSPSAACPGGRSSTTPPRSAGASAGRRGPRSPSVASRPTAGSAAPSPAPARATRRGPWRTRSAATGGTCSYPSRRSTTSARSVAGCPTTAST